MGKSVRTTEGTEQEDEVGCGEVRGYDGSEGVRGDGKRWCRRRSRAGRGLGENWLEKKCEGRESYRLFIQVHTCRANAGCPFYSILKGALYECREAMQPAALATVQPRALPPAQFASIKGVEPASHWEFLAKPQGCVHVLCPGRAHLRGGLCSRKSLH